MPSQCDFGPERRAEARIACEQRPAELTIADTDITTVAAVVVEASRAGLKITSDTRTGPGQQVRVKLQHFVIFGEVRYCRLVGNLYETGIEISLVVGERGMCDRLTSQQIDLLAMGEGLPRGEAMYAHFHTSHCEHCREQLEATQQFFARRSFRESDVERPCDLNAK